MSLEFEFLQIALDHAGHGIVVYDENLVVRAFNRQVFEVFATSADNF